MSSIVKAKQLTYIPMRNDYSADSVSVPGNAPETNQELREIPGASDDMGMIERQENILNKAEKKSRYIESEAQKRADAITATAIKNSRELMEQAEKRGYEEGYLRGLVDGANASEQAAEEGLAELGRLIACFKENESRVVARQEKDLIEIAFELAKKIMKHHAQTDEGAVLKMLEELIAENEGSLKIVLSEYQRSLDVHIDKSVIKKLKNITKDTRFVMVKEENLIMSENDGGIVDMSIPVQLEQLKKVMDHSL